MILVTGSTGFIGRRLVQQLLAGGHDVRALVHTASRGAMLSGSGAEIVEGDVMQPESLGLACDGVDGVVHLAAVVRERGEATFRRLNYEATWNVLQAAAAAGVERIVYASTIGATSDPSVPYLHSRWMAEEEVMNSPIQHTIVRFSVGFGEGDEFFNVLAALEKASPFVPVAGDGQAKFQPISADDVAKCLVAACEMDKAIGKTYEAGGPEHVTYDEMLDLIADTLGVKIIKVHVPVSLMRPGAAIMEALVPRPPVTPGQLSILAFDNTTALDSVESAFGFAPRPLAGNIDYIKRIGFRDALKISLGFMPLNIRDH